jgi:hypothetical protein
LSAWLFSNNLDAALAVAPASKAVLYFSRAVRALSVFIFSKVRFPRYSGETLLIAWIAFSLSFLVDLQ